MLFLCYFFFTDPATTDIYTLSLHDALPISSAMMRPACGRSMPMMHLISVLLPLPLVPSSTTVSPERTSMLTRSEEHTSELQSRPHLVCRLLLEKKKKKKTYTSTSSPHLTHH